MVSKKAGTGYRAWLAVLLALFLAIAAGTFAAYQYYRDTLVSEQESQTTTMAETASGNLSQYFNQRLAELDTQFSPYVVQQVRAANSDSASTDCIRRLISEGDDQDSAVTSLQLVAGDDLDTLGLGITGAGSYFRDMPAQHEFLDGAAQHEDAFVGFWQKEGEGYSLYLFKQVSLDDGAVGYVVETIDLNQVYEDILSSVRVGEKGYCTVKDPSRTIVMHALSSQVGVNTLTDRRDVYAEGDWNDLIDDQYSGDSGCDIVTSYWWDDMEAGPQKKFIAYAPLNVDGNGFVVNVVVSYDEMMQPLQNMWVLCAVLGAVLVAAVALIGWRIARSIQNTRHLETELAYQKQLHAQTKQLKLQERQMQQVDRLQTMGVISSTMAHELKNLMTPLAVYGGMLQDDLSLDERKQISQEIEDLTKRCTDLLERMLAYVRQRPEQAEKTAFDATSAVQDAMRTIGALCPQSVRMATDIADDPCPLHGDPAAMNQILLNLAANALYAMRDDGGELRIEWHIAGDAFVLKVADTGCGMDDETRRRLFQSFYTTKGEEGTGLGLMVVQALVQSMQGSIQVESTLGAGTCFTVSIPFLNGL